MPYPSSLRLSLPCLTSDRVASRCLGVGCLCVRLGVSRTPPPSPRVLACASLSWRGRQRGIDTQKKLAYEEAEKLAHRQEQEKYYKAPPESDSDEGADSGAVDDDAEDKPSTPEA